MKNALTIDLEDWFCVNSLGIPLTDWHKYELRVSASTRCLLDVLEKHRAHATFFALGWIVERVPELMREIEARGHEIGTHGYAHTKLTALTPQAFEKDLEQALQVTATCVRQPMLGYRAPNFTLNDQTAWALEILVNHGLKYDSSVVPLGFHRDAVPASASLGIHPIGPLTEVPLSSVNVFGALVPCSGGIFFRAFPYVLTRTLLGQCDREHRPVVFYLHPWEVDPDHPLVRRSFVKTFRHYHHLDKTLPRLDQLLTDFEFTSVREVLGL